MNRRIAFFGGSFDPPHRGHLEAARAARLALALDAVLFAPVGTQPLKPDGAVASFADRLAMTRLAIAGEQGFEVSSIDAPRAGGAPNYTFKTLRRLREELPPGAELFCLMGADSLAGLRHWLLAAEIPFVAPLIVAARPGLVLSRLGKMLPAEWIIEPAPAGDSLSAPASVPVQVYLLRNRAGLQSRLYWLPEVNVDVSATELRRLISAGPAASAGGPSPLPEPVADYIRAHGLYR